MSESTHAPLSAAAPLRLVTVDQVVDALQEAVAAAGSQKLWASAHGVSPGDLSTALSRKRPPTKAMMRAIGVSPALIQRGMPL